MQSKPKLTNALKALVTLLEEEASKNPAFAEKLENALSELPDTQKKKSKKASPKLSPPDIAEAFQEKGETEFRFWLRDFELPMLKAIVKQNGFDPGKNSLRWKEPDKFIDLIVEQTTARLKRGSAFLPSKDD